jgi:hypothetical protein
MPRAKYCVCKGNILRRLGLRAMAEDSATPKYLRITIDVQLGNRKQTTGRINNAADAAIDSAVEILKKELLDAEAEL